MGDAVCGVVDDVVGADRSHQVHAPGAAHAGHLGAERLGELHGQAAHGARRPDDQDLLAGLEPSGVAQRLEGGESGGGDGRGLLEAEVGRLGHELALGHGGVLGEGAVAPSEDFIARPQLGHAAADRLDAPRQVQARNAVLWSAQPVADAGEVRQAFHHQPVIDPDPSGAHPHQHRIVVDHRLVDLLEGQVIR